MNKKAIKALTVLVAVSLVLLAVMRRSNIPLNPMLYVTLDLWRSGNQSGGYIEKSVLKLAMQESGVSDNVSLTQYWKGHGTSNESWVMRVVINETTQPWEREYPIRPMQIESGTYRGTVIQPIQARGKFRLWILLYDHTNGTRRLESNSCEIVLFYPWLAVQRVLNYAQVQPLCAPRNPENR